MEMFKAGNEEHLKAMKEMQEFIQFPKAMTEWFDNKRKEFDVLSKS